MRSAQYNAKSIFTHALDLQRFSNQLQREAVGPLEALLQSMVSEWRDKSDPDESTITRIRRLNALSVQWKKSLDTVLDGRFKILTKELSEFQQDEADYHTKELVKQVGVPLLGGVQVRSVAISPGYFKAAIQGSVSRIGVPVEWDIKRGVPTKTKVQDTFKYLKDALPTVLPQGDSITQALSRLKSLSRDQLTNTVKAGLIRGDSTDDIVRTLTGTRSRRNTRSKSFGKGSALKKPVDSLRATIRTAAIGVSAQAQLASIAVNPEVTQEQYRYTAVLDSRTTPICQSLDSKVFVVGEGPVPPQHRSCRSVVQAYLDDFYESKGIPAPSRKRSTRINSSGQPGYTTKETMQDWLESVPENDLGRILNSPQRAKLFRENNLSIEQLVRQDGAYYTLDELRTRLRGD